MALLAILTGVLAVFIYRRHVPWLELIVLCAWGLLAANTPVGRIPAQWLFSLSTLVNHWL